MLKPRIIPTLLVSNSGLVKTVKFGSPKYVGDPINTVRLFNEKKVDELLVLDIDASTHNRAPDYQLISRLAKECRMPLCYGGGISKVSQIEKIISLGVEKVAIGSCLLDKPSLIANASRSVGSQSIVLIFNLRKNSLSRAYSLYNHRLKKWLKTSVFDMLAQLNMDDVGELVFNFVDREGAGSGYDLDFASRILKTINIPVTLIGGASSIDDIKKLFNHCPLIGAGAGSIFIFKGKYRAVLVQYPSLSEKLSLYNTQVD